MSDAQQRFERVYPVPADVLFDALREAIESGPYKKASVDEFTKSAVFRSRRSFTSWGHHWQAQVATDPDGARLTMTAAVTVASTEGPGSGKRASEVASRLFADVSSRCAARTR
jgi:hypothetical protein